MLTVLKVVLFLFVCFSVVVVVVVVVFFCFFFFFICSSIQQIFIRNQITALLFLYQIKRFNYSQN